MEIIENLELMGRISADIEKLNPQILKEFEGRTRGFEWIHMGETDITVGKLLEFLRNTPGLRVPRGGHIGSWNNIGNGRAGLVDYNKTICVDFKIGFSLLYSFNMTEDDKLEKGDKIYLPGSIVDGHERELLPLFTWDGSNFVERSRGDSYFTPFVMTKIYGKLVPLQKFHRENMKNFSEFNFHTEADIIKERLVLEREMLVFLVQKALKSENVTRSLKELFPYCVELNGKIAKQDILFEHGKFCVGKVSFSSIEEFVEASLLSVIAATNPDAFFSKIDAYPFLIPVRSLTLSNLLCGLYNTHYSTRDVNREELTKPVNPHFHWGALGMAGYPPYKRGYFSSQEKIRASKAICLQLIEKFPQFDPLLFLLLPVAPFTLCPVKEFDTDIPFIEELLVGVENASKKYYKNPTLTMQSIYPVV